MIKYSAPGKVILSGEHAVVYGKPALVSSISKRLTLTLFSPSDKKTQLKIKKSDYQEDKNIKIIEAIVKKYLKKQKIEFKEKDYSYHIDSEIPISRGLGSSAALSAASVAAFLEFYTGKKFAKEVINNLSYQAEKHFHQNPSGVDNSTACFGGLIYYRKEFEFLKNISLLNFKIPKKIEESLYLIDSGQPKESTKEMVQFVKERYNKDPNVVEEILNQIEKITKKMTISLIQEDKNLFLNCLIDNQTYLEVLGVVSKKTKELLENLSIFGLGKITGAGGRKEGSGFIIFYTDQKRQLESYLKEKNINFFKFKQDFQGVRKDENKN